MAVHYPLTRELYIGKRMLVTCGAVLTPTPDPKPHLYGSKMAGLCSFSRRNWAPQAGPECFAPGRLIQTVVGKRRRCNWPNGLRWADSDRRIVGSQVVRCVSGPDETLPRAQEVGVSCWMSGLTV